MKIPIRVILYGKLVEWLPILFLYLVSGIMLIFITGVVVATGKPKPAWEGEPVFETRIITQASGMSHASSYINTWLRWDTGYYLKIAALGYDREDGSLAFPPLYPMIVRGVHSYIGGDFITIGLLVSNIFCLITLVLLYETAKLELGAINQSQLTVLLYISYPAGFYLYAAYTESLFLSLTLATWLLVKRRNWLLAGVTASLAIITRYQGIILVGLMLWVWISDRLLKNDTNKDSQARGREFHRVTLQRTAGRHLYDNPIIAILLPVLVLLAFTIWTIFENESSPFQARETVNNPLTNPLIGISAVIGRIISGNLILMDWVNLIIFFICASLSILSINKINKALSFYCITTVLLTAWISFGISTRDAFRGQILVSFLRYSLSLFPLFIFVCGKIKKRLLVAPIVGSFLAIQIFLSWLFLQWYWVA